MNLMFTPRNGSGRDDQSHNGTAPLPEPIEEMAGYRRELPSLRHSRTVLGAVMTAVAVSASALSGGVVGVARAVSDPRDMTNVPLYVYQQGPAAVQAWQERCRRTQPTPPQARVVVPSPKGLRPARHLTH
jgi:hypothetical protein